MKKQFVTILAATSLSLSLCACMTTTALTHDQRPKNWGNPIPLSNNFYQIDQDLFRSEQPSFVLLPHIQQKQIGVVINLRTRDRDKKLLQDYPEIQTVHIPIRTWAIDRDDLLSIMQHIQIAKKQNKKVLIHCYHGSDRTGASIAMYRIIFQNWTIEEAVKEMKHGGYGFHSIWSNIDAIFSPENVKWIREQLSNPSIKPI